LVPWKFDIRYTVQYVHS